MPLATPRSANWRAYRMCSTRKTDYSGDCCVDADDVTVLDASWAVLQLTSAWSMQEGGNCLPHTYTWILPSIRQYRERNKTASAVDKLELFREYNTSLSRLTVEYLSKSQKNTNVIKFLIKQKYTEISSLHISVYRSRSRTRNRPWLLGGAVSSINDN